MLYTAFAHSGPAAVRYPRGQGPGVAVKEKMEALPLGKGEIVRRGRRVALLAFGDVLASALEAADELDATVANMRFVKPLDNELINELMHDHELLVTLEDNVVMGGAGSAVNEYLVGLESHPRVLNLGLPDRFLGQGSRGELLSECGLDARGIANAINTVLQRPIAARPAVS